MTNILIFSFGEILRDYLLFFCIGFVVMGLSVLIAAGKEDESTDLYHDYLDWKAGDRTTYTRGHQLMDIPISLMLLLLSILVFVCWEGSLNFCLYFINFDEMGALGFVVRWMPETTFFNIVKGILWLIDFFVNVFFVYLLIYLSSMTLMRCRRGFIIPVISKFLFYIIIAVLYFDDLGKAVCYTFDFSDWMASIIDYCHWGDNFTTGIEYAYPISCFINCSLYPRYKSRAYVLKSIDR